MIPRQNQHQDGHSEFNNKKDARVIRGMIIVDHSFPEMSHSISQELYSVGNRSREPEVAAQSQAQDSKHTYGQIGHANFVLVWTRRPPDRGGCLNRSKHVRVCGKEPSRPT
jgi:hypothetical protein